MKIEIDGGEYHQETLTEAPDEMGTYGSSSEYVFWFDPNGQIHQWNRTYFVSPVLYKIDEGKGTVTVEIDVKEQNKIPQYNKQIEQSLKESKKKVQEHMNGGN